MVNHATVSISEVERTLTATASLTVRRRPSTVWGELVYELAVNVTGDDRVLVVDVADLHGVARYAQFVVDAGDDALVLNAGLDVGDRPRDASVDALRRVLVKLFTGL